ncbi:hypothetical protein PybrP1_009272 [[Pythium] brassicae (nom. inval.)]|nr:hypothetical protein PybrP1_009272 [[Pythium] brassicae (nom. inval.)]
MAMSAAVGHVGRFSLWGKPVSSEIEWLKPLLKISSDLEMLLQLLVGILVLFGLYLWVVVGSREYQTTFQYLLHKNEMEVQATAQTKDTVIRRYVMAQTLNAAEQDRLQQLKLCEQILADWRGVLDAKLKQLTLGAPREPEVPDRDALLVLASRVFPLDYTLFGVLFLYVFLVAFVALTSHGARFLCFRINRRQPRLMSSFTMVVVSLMIIYLASVELFNTLTLAPQTTMFGR